jgi:hypothetical protein
MAVQPRDPKKAKTEPEKKKPETVLLSPEELQRLSGGKVTNPIAAPPPTPGDVKKKP